MWRVARRFCGDFGRRTLLVATCLALGACGLSQGIAEYEIYRSAFEKTYGTSTAILDQLAVQERELFLRSRKGRIDPTNVKFDPNLATYYSDATDPPGTAAFRRALATVKAYNDLLYGLASGQTAEALVAKLGELNSKIGEAAGEVGSLLGGPAQGDLLAATAALNQVFGQIAPFVRAGLTFRSREEFR